MVKHGRDKKRRAGRTGKTKLKNRSWTRYDPNPKVNKALKPFWDPSITPTANLEKLGLLAQPNKNAIPSTKSGRKSIRAQKTNNDNNKDSSSSRNSNVIIQLFDVPDSDKPTRRSRFPLNKEEEEYIAKCMAKWGVNYTKMFRDIKINDMQYTEEQLRKLGSRYLLLSSNQRHVEVPDTVKSLISSTADVNNSE